MKSLLKYTAAVLSLILTESSISKESAKSNDGPTDKVGKCYSTRFTR
jgi:hypothetical protein